MHTSFKIKTDKVDSLQYTNFLPAEIDYLLNVGKDRVIKTRYSGINAKGQGFEQSQKRIDDLRTIVNKVTYTLTPADFIPSETYYNITLAKLAISDYLLFIKDYLTITDNTCNKKFNVSIKFIEHDKFSSVLNDPFHQPTLNNPVKLVTDNFIELYFSKQLDLTRYTIVYNFTYLRQPILIDLANINYTELPEHLEDEIINEAVANALEYIEQPRQKTFQREYITQE
jgi:hypothetical protein